jgi:hypothetical protein
MGGRGEEKLTYGTHSGARFQTPGARPRAVRLLFGVAGEGRPRPLGLRMDGSDRPAASLPQAAQGTGTVQSRYVWLGLLFDDRMWRRKCVTTRGRIACEMEMELWEEQIQTDAQIWEITSFTLMKLG